MAAQGAENTSKIRIYRDLKKQIIMGRKQPGERIAIDDIRTLYGTSVTPVRDALQMLGQEALVSIKPRSGYYVTRISFKQLKDMLEYREILETAAIERAAENITDRQIEDLKGVHRGYTGEDDDSYARYTEENRRFHYLIARGSGNLELAENLGHLLDRLARFMVIRHAGKNLEKIHGNVIEKLKNRDVPGARKALIKELKDTRTAIMEKVMQEESANWQVGSGGEAAEPPAAHA